MTEPNAKPRLVVVGLGYGDEQGLPLGNWQKLQQAARLYVRTAHHPVMDFLRREGIRFESFDAVYDECDRYEDVYRRIVQRLVTALKEAEERACREVVYAVPGHPMVAERSVQLLLDAAADGGFAVDVMPAPSFLDVVSARLAMDPIDGWLVLDGTVLHRSQLNPKLATIVAQVYDRAVASDVKLTLMDVYPDDYPVIVANALGVAGQEVVEQLPLYELDRDDSRFGHLTLVVVPAAEEDHPCHLRRYERALDVVATLRGPDGCPWDQKQTHQSLRRYLLEETAELLEAIDAQDPDGMQEELGDVLLQILLHAQIASETGYFHMDDVIGQLNEKLIRRHPHVFGSGSADSAEEVAANWEQIKQREREEKGGASPPSRLAAVPPAVSALLTAERLQRLAAEVGFDWPQPADVLDKVQEELQEVRRASEAERPGEMGDLLFAVVNLCRVYGVDPEAALAGANQKFRRRFQYIEERLRESGRTFEQTDLAEMDAWWEEAKRREKYER